MIETRSSYIDAAAKSTIRKDRLGVLHKSPGEEKRKSEEITPPYRLERGLAVDDLFDLMQSSGTYFPGELALYDLSTGVQLRISTGVGDSEIVLATDEAVYYRVDDTLYRRTISGSVLGEPVKLAQSEEIAQVHWAFLN
jgi:hypothetical protein